MSVITKNIALTRNVFTYNVAASNQVFTQDVATKNQVFTSNTQSNYRTNRLGAYSLDYSNDYDV
jgi:hypothetical protein